MSDDVTGASVPDQALAVPAEPASGLVPPGFDPSRVQEVLSDGDGFWRTCSGCHEMSEGCDVGYYPHSDVFGCKLGGGCGDCGGIGVVWDNADYEDFARYSLEQDAIHYSRIRHLKNLDRGLCDVLLRLKSRTVGMDPKLAAIAYGEVPDWLLRQWLERVRIIQHSLAQGIAARSDETLKASQPVGQEPGAGTACTQTPPVSA